MFQRNGSELQLRLRVAAYLVVAALVLILFDQFGWLRPAQQVISTFLYPVQRGVHQFGENVANLGAFTKSLDELRAENRELREQYQAALSDQGKLAALAQENAELKRQLDFKSNPDSARFTIVSAEVINRGSDLNQAIIINKGSNDGIVFGKPVIDASGYLVGRVQKVEPQKSTILLITDTNIGVNVTTRRFDKDNKVVDIPGGGADGTAIGQWQVGGRVLMTLIKSEADVKEGDWVFTNGIGGIYPQNLLVGNIQQVIARDGQPEKQATLKPIADLDHLQRVQVILSWGDLPK
jgi:rod shape-determining protein MreC